jgi:hypothetical protein
LVASGDTSAAAAPTATPEAAWMNSRRLRYSAFGVISEYGIAPPFFISMQ